MSDPHPDPAAAFAGSDGVRPPGAGPEPSGVGRARSALKVVAMVVAVVLIVIGASQLVTNVFESRRSSTQRFGGAIVRVVVDSDHGEITVTPAAGGEVVVERDERYVFRRPDRRAELTGSTLALDDGCPSFNALFLGGCRVDFRISVPPGTALELESSNGDLSVEGISAPMVLRTSNGDVEVDRVSGSIDARTSNGSIVGRSLTSAAVTAGTDNGRITLVFDDPPESVVADTDNGDVEIQVPDLAYRVDADTDNGDVDVDVVSDPGAGRTIDARSDNGDIGIRRR